MASNTTFTTNPALTSLTANSSDKFSDGKKHLYPDTGSPITHLHYMGQYGGLYYYCAVDDQAAQLPICMGAPVVSMS